MELKLKKLDISNFKGIKQKVIEFSGNKSLIMGQNGSGKTTCGSALSWIISDTDIELNKGPVVTPIGESECVTKVIADLEIDGKPLTIAKIQKYKEKTDDDGKVTSSITNSYEINSVAKVQRDFLSDLQERGINTEDFMVLVNPNQFTADNSKKGREQMREILFKMAEEYTDIDIAKEINADEVVALLEKYKLDEIEASAKSSIREITDNNGKNNEIIDGRIQGILDSKVQIDIKELEKTKESYESELKEVRANLDDLNNADNKALQKIAELEGQLVEIERKERLAIDASKDELYKKIRKAEEDKNTKEIEVLNAQVDLNRIKDEISSIEESLNNYRELYKTAQERVFDESSTVCVSCGRPFPEDQIEEMRKTFEEGKTKQLADFKSKGETFAKKLETLKKKYEENKAAYEKLSEKWKNAEKKAGSLKEEMRDYPQNPNLLENKKYIETKSQIEALRNELQQKGDFRKQELANRETYLKQMIRQIVGDIAVADRNKELDKQIAALRKKKKDDEVIKAEKEKILSQVDNVRRHKDDKLAESINKHFSLVKWKFWEYQRNGEKKSICEPYVDGMPMSSCANGSLRTLAKVSICHDIQKTMDVSYPIFIDDYTLFSSNSIDRIDVGNSQLIGLVVTEDKELRVEEVN